MAGRSNAHAEGLSAAAAFASSSASGSPPSAAAPSSVTLHTIATSHAGRAVIVAVLLGLLAMSGALPADAAPMVSGHQDALSTSRSQSAPSNALYLPAVLADAALPRAIRPPPALVAWPDRDVRTLILTDLRALAEHHDLAPTDPELVALQDGLAHLAAHDAVAGRVVWDLRTQTDTAVADAVAAWSSNTAPARWTPYANALALALRDWIAEQRRTRHPGLRHVVIVGDDRIVPHLRLRIDAPFDALDDGWVTETAYFHESTVGADTAVGIALAEDMTLTDDVYGAARPMDWGPQRLALYLPDVAVGRLVEQPRDMSAVVDTFLRTGGTLTVERSLTACYDFMQDACEASDARLAAAGLSAAASHTLMGDGWTVDDLRAALTGDFDLFFYGVHAKHYVHETPRNGILYAGEMTDLLGARDGGRIAYGLACHAGLSTPGADAHPEPVDFPETWLAAGVSYVASTGWAYGFDGQMQYQEKLLAWLTDELVRSEADSRGARSLGAALVQTKRRYYLNAEVLDHLHAKTLAGTVLYGLPMTRVELADGSPAQPGPVAPERWPTRSGRIAHAGTDVPTAANVTETRGAWIGQAYRTHANVRIDPDRLVRTTTPQGDYITLADHPPRVQAGTPLQPQLRLPLGALVDGQRQLLPRGVVWTGARYHDVPRFRPLVRPARVLDARTSSATRQARPVADDSRAHGYSRSWQPARSVELRTLPVPMLTDQALLDQKRPADTAHPARPPEGVLHLTLGQLDGTTRTERLYTELALDVYYSDAADRTPPTITAVDVTTVLDMTAVLDGRAADSAGSATTLQITGRVSDRSGVARVVATWTTGDGRWRHRELVRAGDGRWSVGLPADALIVIQAVDTAGNVAVVPSVERQVGRAVTTD